MPVLHVCTEVYPLLKTGGLADVTGALPRAQLGQCDARLLLPGLPAILAGVHALMPVAVLPPRFGVRDARLLRGQLADGLTAYVIAAPALYERPGNPYADANGLPYADNALRFALLGWVAARLCQGLDPHWQPCVLHCHDWHAGLAPAYVAAARRATGRALAGTVFTVHNLAYQGSFAEEVFGQLGLPGDFYGIEGLEFYGQVSFLKAGLYYADKLTTVSPSYGREIATPEQGCGLDGLLRARARDLHGILNGIDGVVWDPASDARIAANYNPLDRRGKGACKRALQQECGLQVRDGAPLFVMVSRLTEQKGVQLLLGALPEIVASGSQLLVLGSGEARYEHALRAAANTHAGQVAVRIGYDEDLAHRMFAGGDVCLVPSRYEPCGLTQLYGLRYGALPLVRRVGGLADTVVDATLEDLDTRSTGFCFDAFTQAALGAALRRVQALWRRSADWAHVQERAMRQPVGWDDAAAHYLRLYQDITP
ncbi:glycogen synthase GlgA [Massilia sp. TS11]|uniref:glycogen synthase GlgA n=1 Tax=Massilia sp. TS11 TaxID=2908003 RepID=UPI001EDA6CFD|nr:glycogen synthase GlgA [Massilia sp. TS11]MCG2583742.1 glycogen synthase GlgA [Massilia sp. TS11]